VGLFLLPVLLVETVTGALLFAFGRGIVPKGSEWAQAVFDFLAAHNLLQLQDIGFQTDLHVWVGYLTAWAILLKAIASWPTLVGWWPRRFAPLHLLIEKAAAWGLLVLAPASYLTGTALALHFVSLREHLVHDLHLYTSALLVLVLAWHVWHFLPTGLRVMAVQVRHLKPSRRTSPLPRRDR
jgi:hypothetical protein